MTPEVNGNNFLTQLIELLKQEGSSGFREVSEVMYNLALVSEREEALKSVSLWTNIFSSRICKWF